MDQGSFLIIFMREVTSGPEIESEVRYSIDLGSFVMSSLRMTPGQYCA